MSEEKIDAKLRYMGAPTHGSLARKKERLARLEHYDFKRFVNRQYALKKLEDAWKEEEIKAGLALLGLKTDSSGL